MPRICDYEGSRYRTDFWEGQNRQYEDGVERVAIQKLLPPGGRRLIEVGAGFGRLADLYRGYQQVVLTDYARTQLEEAQTYLGQDERFIFVVADIYRLNNKIQKVIFTVHNSIINFDETLEKEVLGIIDSAERELERYKI